MQIICCGVRRVAFASWTSNWSSCFSQIPWIVPKLLYCTYANNTFTFCVKLSIWSTTSIYQDLSCAAMTGAPVCEKVIAMTWKKHFSKFSVPPVAFKILFQSCASYWVLLMTSSIDSCLSLYLRYCRRRQILTFQWLLWRILLGYCNMTQTFVYCAYPVRWIPIYPILLLTLYCLVLTQTPVILLNGCMFFRYSICCFNCIFGIP